VAPLAGMMPTKSKNKGRSSFFIKREPFGQRADLYSSERSN